MTCTQAFAVFVAPLPLVVFGAGYLFLLLVEAAS